MEVESRGNPLVRLEPGRLLTDGSWGLGTGPGSTVVWHNLRVSRGRPATATQAR